MPSRLAVLPALVVICLLGLVFSAGAQAAGGTAFGWGENDSGQVGNGAPGANVLTPTPVVGLPANVTQIAGGYDHAVALLSDGTVRAWGENSYGQLGDGSTTDSPTPVTVSGLSGVVAVAVSADTSLALLANGTVVAWGANYYGQLGNGGNTGPDSCEGSACSKIPVPVPGLASVVALAGGYEYSVALLANGTVMTWGYDYYGELGRGAGTEEGCYCISTPQPVPGVTGAVAISAGWYQAAALLQDGTVKDWGWNYYGDLGGGFDSSVSPPDCNCSGPVTVSGVSGAKATAAGGYHGLALLGDGALKSWGSNEYGQLGVGANTGPEECDGYPCSKVAIPAGGGLASTQAVAAGAYHSLALSSNGTVTAWGYNGDGALGDGTEEERSTPVPVSGLSGVSGISANDYTSYAIVGPSQTLSVALAGAGAGTVGGPTGVLCSANCAARFPQGQVETLKAIPAPGSGFAGFSGPCTGTATCQVTLGADQTVTATFGPPKGTAITATTVKKQAKKKPVAKAQRRGKKKAKPIARSTASLSFSAPGAITGYECKLIRPRVKPKPKHHKKHKHGAKSSKRGKAKAPVAEFVPCVSPQVYKNLKPGSYTFETRALDILGADAVPAVAKFSAKR